MALVYTQVVLGSSSKNAYEPRDTFHRYWPLVQKMGPVMNASMLNQLLQYKCMFKVIIHILQRLRVC